jgi:solute carrier family 25 carnitine/acylcarnitine transporter 20/29
MGATSLSVIRSTAASVLAGGVGSAVGMFVAYPIDVLKTKAQVVRKGEQQKQTGDLLSRAKSIYKEEGIHGFFGGVLSTIIGKAMTSCISFGLNQFGISFLNAINFLGGGVEGSATPFLTLLLSACFTGVVITFFNVPIDRVKVMMQAQENNALYVNELDCIKAVLQSEGWVGLLTRGFGPTLAIALPCNAIYFLVYGLLMQTTMKESIGMWASVVAGAAAGMACWIPVYPIDVVKTRMQNTKGGKADASGGLSVSAWDIAIIMYSTEGIGSFYRGIELQLFRAAVSNGVTFLIYDLILDMFGYSS